MFAAIQREAAADAERAVSSTSTTVYTLPPVTSVIGGLLGLPVLTTLAPATDVLTLLLGAEAVTATTTLLRTVLVVTTLTPAAAAASCSALGGHFGPS